MSSISIAGDTSGSVVLQAPAVAGTTTLTLPAATGTLLTTAGGQTISGNTTVSGTVVMGSAFTMRNKIINGAMVIDQRNAGASVTPAADQYLVDRFNVYLSQSAKFSAQQNAGSVTPPSGFTNYLGLTVAAAANVTVGAGDYFGTRQMIEGFNVADLGWGSSGALTVTLSFWVRCSLTGTMGGSLTNSSRSYPFTFTVNAANTWEYKTITVSGDTSGTWNKTNGVGIEVRFSLGGGSSFAGTAGVWAAGNFVTATGATNIISTNGATFYITGVQLEIGTAATPFEYRNYQQELAMCQRYFANNQLFNIFAPTANVGNFGGAIAVFKYPVTMRATPTISFSGQSSSLWVGSTTPSTDIRLDSVQLWSPSTQTSNGAWLNGLFAVSAEL